MMIGLVFMTRKVRVRLGEIEQDLWHAYFCSPFCWIRSDFELELLPCVLVVPNKTEVNCYVQLFDIRTKVIQYSLRGQILRPRTIIFLLCLLFNLGFKGL